MLSRLQLFQFFKCRAVKYAAYDRVAPVSEMARRIPVIFFGLHNQRHHGKRCGISDLFLSACSDFHGGNSVVRLNGMFLFKRR